jgi:dienelactone hydrolase
MTTGKRDGTPVVVAGQLRIPRQGTERLPAVILVHGSGGVSGYVDDWAQWLNALGVATFVLDSFTGRGLVSVGNDQAKLGRLAMIVDTYRALELLAKHPRVDASRIAVMGFSRGGQAALYSSLKRFQRMHLSGSPSFAAYIVFYPDCRTVYRDDEDVANVPIRIFHGGADDYSPVDTCRLYVDRLRKAGKDVELKEYPGAHHAFDWPMLKAPVKLPQAQTTRRCRLEESVDGTIINSERKNLFTYSDPCVELGPTIAHSPEAFAEAQKDVRAFVLKVLDPK